MPYTRAGQPFAANSDTSFEAALHANRFVKAQGIRVWRWLQSRDAYGGTQIEAAGALSIGRPSLCARFRALEDVGAITRTAVKREAAAVYIAPVYPSEQLRLL